MDNWIYCFECIYFDTCECPQTIYDSVGCYFGKAEEEDVVDEDK